MKSYPIMKLPGANMDIDLTTPAGQIQWEQQSSCPWNKAEVGNTPPHYLMAEDILFNFEFIGSLGIGVK